MNDKHVLARSDILLRSRSGASSGGVCISFPGFSLLNCCDLKWLNCKKGSSTLFIFRFYICSNWWHCTNMKIVWHARSLELRKWLSSPRFLKGSLPRFPGSTKSQRRQRCQIYRPIIHSWRICPNRPGQSDHNPLTSICCAFDAFFFKPFFFEELKRRWRGM